MRRRITLLGLLLVAANIACWFWALLQFRGHPALLGTALLAYGFGLRHAVDADHIAAIDNATRKLIQDGQRPLGVGLFFSLGHSSVVVLLSLALALTATGVERHFGMLRAWGGIMGSLVSVSVLLVLGVTNLLAVKGLWRRLQQGGPDPGPVAGPMGWLFGRANALIGRSWHLFPLGFLFGLGFDTATEIGVLGVSAANAAEGLPIVGILVFPALFSAGMALLDTADGLLMLGAYGWAFIAPRRKLFYNLTITATSALAALAIGLLEALGLVGERLGLDGGVWRAVDVANQHFTLIGLSLVGLFALGWVVSAVLWRERMTSSRGAS